MIYINYLEDYIKQFYHHLGISIPDQLEMHEIAFRMNVKIFFWNNSSQALIRDGRYYLFINNTLPNDLQWQEFCHELGHLLMHIGDQMNLPPLFVEYQENKANNFALHAAAPTFMIDQLNLPNTYQEAVRLLQETFYISLTFACKRLDHYINNHLFASQIHW